MNTDTGWAFTLPGTGTEKPIMPLIQHLATFQQNTSTGVRTGTGKLRVVHAPPQFQVATYIIPAIRVSEGFTVGGFRARRIQTGGTVRNKP